MRAACALACAAAWALVLPGCGKEVPKGGVIAVPTFQTSRKVDPGELLPADLDLVVRIDLGRLRGGLGPSALDALAARLPGESMLRGVLAKADAVTIGLRADDLEAGDRVVVIEGSGIELLPDPKLYEPAPPIVEQVKVWDAATPPSDRAAIARVMQIEQRAVVFVTPLEVDATTRVLREGADEHRGQPFAEGLVSADWRPAPLRPALAKKYPSIAGVLKGIARVRATAIVDGEALVLRGEITGTSEAAATRAAKFVSLLRDNAGEGDASPLRGLAVEPAGGTVHLVWTIPAEVVLRAVSPGRTATEEAPTQGPTTERPTTKGPATEGPAPQRAEERGAVQPAPSDAPAPTTPAPTMPAPTPGATPPARRPTQVGSQ